MDLVDLVEAAVNQRTAEERDQASHDAKTSPFVVGQEILLEEFHEHNTQQDPSNTADGERAGEQRDPHLRLIPCLSDFTLGQGHLLPDQLLRVLEDAPD
jgi:hypothetical protein